MNCGWKTCDPGESGRAPVHLEFCYELNDLQAPAGQYFLHEHPQEAKSHHPIHPGPELIIFCCVFRNYLPYFVLEPFFYILHVSDMFVRSHVQHLLDDVCQYTGEL